MIDYYILEEIQGEDHLRLISPDEGRAWKKYSWCGVGVGIFSFLIGVTAYFSSGLTATLRGGLQIIGMLGVPVFFYFSFELVYYGLLQKLPIEVLFKKGKILLYGKKHKILRTVFVGSTDQLTVKVLGRRVEIYHKKNLDPICWYFLPSKSNSPDVHVSIVLSIFGRDPVEKKHIGKTSFVHRSVGRQRASDSSLNNTMECVTDPIDRYIKFSFYEVFQSKTWIKVSLPRKYFYGGYSNFVVRPKKIIYGGLEIRPQEVEGLVCKISHTNKGRFGYNLLVPIFTIFIKAKTGSEYELMSSALNSENDQLKVEDFEEETQRLCDEVNALFLRDVN